MTVLTQARLKALLSYSKRSGLFRWLVNRGKAKVGQVAGSIREDQYVLISVDGRLFYAHVLAHLYVLGEFPAERLDHRDRNPTNNRWLNLRPATCGQNNFNAKVRRDNKLGLKGVTQNRHRYVARITVDKKTLYLGIFPTPQLAYARRLAAQAELHGEFARAA